MYLGVDVGTSVTKAAIFDEGGELRAVHSRRTRLESPAEGWFEQDPAEVVVSVATVAREAVAEAGAAPSSIGLTGQGDGVWLVDEHGHAVRPAISWMDGRAAGILTRWLADGVVEKAYRRTGNIMFPGSAAYTSRPAAARWPSSRATHRAS